MPCLYPGNIRNLVVRTVSSAVLSVLVFLTAAHDVAAQGTGNLLMNTYPSNTRPNTNFSGTPLTSGPVTIIDQVNLNPAGRADYFSVRIEGYILAETTGTYTFETYSDDGVRVFVNGSTVIDNYGLHAPTINRGDINLVAGTWVPFRIDHYEWGGGQRLRLRWRTPGASSFVYPPAAILSQTLPVSAGGPPLNTQDDRVAFIITEEAKRQLQADIASNQRANRDARARHATALRCQRLEEEDQTRIDPECQDDALSKAAPLQFNGSLNGTSQSQKLVGDFYQAISKSNGVRHIYSGDFDVTRFEGGDVSAVFTARYARERMVGDRLIGTFLALSANHTEIEDVVTGNRSGYGLSAGVYMVDQLTEELTWDGFLSIGTGRNNLDIQDGGSDIQGNYNTTSALLGFALSGERSYERFDLRPELSVSVGYTDIGNVNVSGGTSPIVDAGGVTLARLSFQPDFVFSLANGQSRFDTKELWVTPSVTCEYQDTTYTDQDCGGGLALEWTADRDDGLLDVSFRVSREVLGGETRDSVGFQLESAF